MAFVSMANAVPGAIASSSEYNNVVANVNFLYANNGRGWKAINVNTTQVGSITTTEVVTDSVTWTAESGRRYLVMSQAGIFCTSSGDQFNAKIRYASGGSVTNTGTIATGGTQQEGFKGTSVRERFSLFGLIVNPAAGTITAGLTIQRATGSGTITRDGSSDNNSTLMVFDIGPN